MYACGFFDTHVEVRRQRGGLDSFFLLFCRSQGLNSVIRFAWQAPSPAEASHKSKTAYEIVNLSRVEGEKDFPEHQD